MANSAEEGQRIHLLNRKREKALEDLAIRKRKLADEMAKPKVGTIADKFDRHVDVIEAKVRNATVGLMTLDQIREQKAKIEKEEEAEEKRKKKELKKKKKKKKKGALSFADDLDGDGDGDEAGKAEDNAPKRPKTIKNPNVDTSFLPDRDREAQEAAERDKLKQDWLAEQQVIKDHEIDVTYSYWDGAGHRRTTRVTKGTTISGLLSIVQKEFHDLRSVSSDGLMFIKEDLIIPQHYSFYDLIVTKARGKSGPLTYWDVHEDVRMVSDATVEKEESHAAKVCERRWYERNKHIFPASRWEVYDPSVKRDKYTIHGGEVR